MGISMHDILLHVLLKFHVGDCNDKPGIPNLRMY